jgi:hypothetical protein
VQLENFTPSYFAVKFTKIKTLTEIVVMLPQIG